jgi:hypothetical protein
MPSDNRTEMERRTSTQSRRTRAVVVIALVLWLTWFLTTVAPLIGFVPIDVVIRLGIPFGAALPAAILATMFALYLARADAPRGAQPNAATDQPVDPRRLRRHALMTAGVSLALWAAVILSATGLGPNILGGLRLPMAAGAALFSALTASALRQARASGPVPMPVRVIGRTATIVSLVLVLLALGGTLLLAILLRDSF